MATGVMEDSMQVEGLMASPQIVSVKQSPQGSNPTIYSNTVCTPFLK